ncbi:MAG: hypothetical protein CVV64_20400 [Candidatus Wallbacteria bacterium HGW-Wallbacteria-1]|jgi:Zn-dependent M28 family amino/carboxypeptidase|uniref:Peptidase M28 domain-containing protein n=1 Tax=Candidatus Wallbacteria bacterium HGW-Wallbacteria-1 TaxID=2013854 RepID=A0A2N1PIC5_9BACT|nr:MAG: hypothetical protein CVV64_20400 [Candidatus Wallbacteria bacterium HGW-Wallbacteria-1]
MAKPNVKPIPTDFSYIPFLLLKILMIAPLLKFNFRPVTVWDDNATGLVSALYLAETLKKRGFDNIQFLFFDNEEKGRLGSKGFVEHIKDNPSYSGTKVINIDSVGRGKAIYLAFEGADSEADTVPADNGSDYKTDHKTDSKPEFSLARAIIEASSDAEIQLKFNSESDCKFFTLNSIEALTLTRYDDVMFCGQKQQDLSWTHTYDDTRDKIDYDKITEVIRIVENYLNRL